MAGGKGGPAVLPGKGAESPLVEALRGDGATDRMPLNRPPLAGGRDQAHRDLDRPGSQGQARRKAGRAPGQGALGVRPAVETGRAAKLSGRAGHATRSTASSRRASKRLGLSPSAEADRRTLIRRLSLDLTGLPASPEEVDAFVKRSVRPARPTESWTGCWRRLTSASAGLASGSTRPAMPIRTATTSMPPLDLEVSRLGHRGDQLRHAVRPVRHAPARRRPLSGRRLRARASRPGFIEIR